MTDNEIIKAFECCLIDNCDDCPCADEEDCVRYKMQASLEVINRQKAEIEALINGQETLQKYISKQNVEIERLEEDNNFHIRLEALLVDQRDKRDKLVEQIDAQNDELRMKLKTAKSEAIKELFEKIKKEKMTHRNLGEIVYIEVIEELLKEMEGKDNV